MSDESTTVSLLVAPESQADTVLLWLCDTAGSAEFFSPMWLSFTGKETSSLLGNGWFDCLHPDDNPVLAAAIDTAIGACNRQDFRLKLRIRRNDGEFVPFSCDGVVRMGKDGQFAGLVGVCTDITRQERERAEAELAGRHFVDLLPQNDLVTLALDNSGKLMFFNPALTQLLGDPAHSIGKTEILGRFLDRQHRPLSELLFPASRPADKLPSRIESEFIAGREGQFVFVWHAIPLRDYSGQQSGIILIGDELTDSRLAEEKLRLTSRVFDTSDLAMIITDPRGTILSTNAAFSILTGYSAEEAIGNNPRILQSGRHDQAFYQAMWGTLANEGRWQGEIWDKRKDGTVYPKFLSVHALRNDAGEITHYSGVFYDISERKAAEEKLSRLAYFDALTELPNRKYFYDKLRLACHQCLAGTERIALLFVDLDHFKTINDTMGHQAGDTLLRETAKRLRSSIRSHDMAARIGGDEFAVLLADVKDAGNAQAVARKILEAFIEVVDIEGTQMSVSPSIGIALCPDHAGDADTLVRMADEAMYRAKAAGRNTAHLHEV